MHMRRPPSSAHLWVHCGSVPAMIARYPQPETDESMEGTAAHEYVTGTFLGQIFAAGTDLAQNGVVISQEMIDAGAELLADLERHRKFFAMVKGRPEIQVEQFLHAPGIAPDCGGTPDFFAVDWANKAIYIWDYKYGHRYVPVYPNWQLTAYVDAIISYVGVPRHGPDANGWTIRAVIAQPRCYQDKTLREAIYGLEEHLALVEWLVASTHLDLEHQQTGDYCKDCPGRHACESLRKVGGFAIEESGRVPPQDLTPLNMGVELRMLRKARDRMDALISGLETSLLHHAKAGTPTPGFRIGRKRGSIKWKLDESAIGDIGDTMGAQLRKPAVLTPTQAKKKFPLLSGQIDALSEPTAGAEELQEVTEEMVSAIFQA